MHTCINAYIFIYKARREESSGEESEVEEYAGSRVFLDRESGSRQVRREHVYLYVIFSYVSF